VESGEARGSEVAQIQAGSGLPLRRCTDHCLPAVRMRGMLSPICLIILLQTAPAAEAGRVSGQFRLGTGVVITPKTAAAYPVREQYDARTESVEIVLSTEPVDAAAAVAALNPHMEAINQDALRQDNYILLWVTPDGRVSMNATFTKTMTQYLDRTGGGGGLAATLSAHTPGHVSGRIFTPAPVKVMSGESYTCDFTFDVDVTRLPAGVSLPPGGGEPGRAFAALLASAEKKNWDALRGGVSIRLRKIFDADYRTPEENLEYAVDFLQMQLPKRGTKVTGGVLRGESATLEIEGEMFAGQKAVYFARMVRSGGIWLFDGSTLAGMVK
jgi:hypothetical protein